MDKITFGFKKDEYFFKMKTLPFWCEREYGIEVDGYLGQIYNIIGCDCGPNVILDKEIKKDRSGKSASVFLCYSMRKKFAKVSVIIRLLQPQT